jgi:hypothetical protein
MPYLRYSRDKRGYEHTYVLHGSRAGGRPRILYWFRTPPHVVVGRDALDQEATKAIENGNPDLDFDWPKMRRERPKPPSRQVATPERMRKGNRRSAPASANGSPDVALKKKPPVEKLEVEPGAETPVDVSSESSVDVSSRKFGKNAPSAPPEEHPVSALLGDRMLLKLQSSYAALERKFRDAQITESMKNELGGRINSLNPDNWVAGEEVIFRIEQFESEVAAIQALLNDS